jgi:putative sigma-54 modulation protein
MGITIQSLRFKADSRLKDFIESKCSKLNQYFDGIVDIQVVLRLERNPGVGNKVVEIKTIVPNQTLIASEKAATFEAATDMALDTLARQVKRYKEKLRAA